MHITMAFIGDVELSDVKRVRETLRYVNGKLFSTRTTNLTVFPAIRQPRLIVASLENPPALQKLQQDIVSTLAEARLLDPEDRPYHPHVTLARLKKEKPRRVHGFIEETDLPVTSARLVSSFSLYSSDLTPDGAVYHQEETYPLTA